MTDDEIVALLTAEDPEARRRAVVLLPDVRGDVRDDLMRALADPDWRVRKEAARVAAELASGGELLTRLIAAVVQPDDVGLRSAALEAVGRIGPPATHALLTALEAADDRSRKFLLDALGGTQDPRAVPALAAIAASPDANDAAAALDALCRVGGDEAVRALCATLASEDPYRRLAALDGLARLRAVVPWPALAALTDEPLARRVALPVLGRSRSPRAVTPLVAALAEPSRHVMAGAAAALAGLHGGGSEPAAEVERRMREATPELRERLRSLIAGPNSPHRHAAALLLLLARDASALGAIVSLAATEALSPPSLDALRAWGRGAIAPLLEVFRRHAGVGRGTALELAADLAAGCAQDGAPPEPDLLDALRRALLAGMDDPDEAVALGALRGLSWWARPEDAAPVTELAARAPAHGAVARAAADVLDALVDAAPAEVGTALDSIRPGGGGEAALASVVAHLGGSHALEMLRSALSSDEPTSRRAAVGALGRLGGSQAAELVTYALADEDPDVQVAAAQALGGMRAEGGAPLGVAALLGALESESPTVVAAAARALGEAGDPGAGPALRARVSSQEPGVAVAALEALRALGDGSLSEILLDALAHPDAEVVKQALSAVDLESSERAVARLSLGLSHAAWDVRAHAARRLSLIGGDAALDALRARRAEEPDPAVREAIEEGISLLEGRRP